jgi:hypothetical protein
VPSHMFDRRARRPTVEANAWFSGCGRLLLDGEDARCSGGQREDERSGEDDLLHGDLLEGLPVDDAVFVRTPAKRCDGHHLNEHVL